MSPSLSARSPATCQCNSGLHSHPTGDEYVACYRCIRCTPRCNCNSGFLPSLLGMQPYIARNHCSACTPRLGNQIVIEIPNGNSSQPHRFDSSYQPREPREPPPSN